MIVYLSFLILLFFAMGIPVGFSIGLASLIILFFMNIPFFEMAKQMYVGINSFPIVAVPLYILAGELMAKGGTTDKLVDFASIILGNIRGCLAHICVAASMFFAGISGSSIADTAAIGSVMIPGMLKKGYSRGFTASLQACAGSIGPIIPPSIPMVIFGMLTDTSVGKLFIGGIIPGMMMGFSLMIVAYIINRRRGYVEKTGVPSFRTMLKITKDASLALVTPVIIVGGIMSGDVTATESGVLAVVYALCLGIFVYRKLKFPAIFKALVETCLTTGTVIFIVASAMLFTWLMTINEIPQTMVSLLMSLTTSKWMVLLILNVLLLILGCLVDTLSLLIIFSPLFLKITSAYGIHPIHLGLIMVVNLTIGMCTPPFGVNLFVVVPLAKTSMEEILHDLMLFLIPLFIVLFIITYIPETVMFLPRLLMP